MTLENLKELGIPLRKYDETTVLYIVSGLEWLQENTILKFEKEKIEDIKALPPGAKLFLLQYIEIMDKSNVVTSESIGELSHTFLEQSNQIKLKECAKGFLSKYLKPQVTFYPCKQRF